LLILRIKPPLQHRLHQKQADDKDYREKDHGKKNNFRIRKPDAGFLSKILLVFDDELIPGS
jgi:hypothetical protein